MKIFGIGVGFAGGRVLDRMYAHLGEERFAGALVINTSRYDVENLENLRDRVLLLGESDQGVGRQWKLARRLMSGSDSREMVISVLKKQNIRDADVVIIPAALGGGTGGGAAGPVAGCAREIFEGSGVVPPVIVLGILPFSYPLEPIKLLYNTTIALANLLDEADSIFLVDNNMFRQLLQSKGVVSDVMGEVNSRISSFLDVIFSVDPPVGRGPGGGMTAQDLKAILALKEASLCAPCYSEVRAETVERALDVPMELTLEEGKLVNCEPSSAFRAMFTIRALEENISMAGVMSTRKLLMSRIAGIDVINRICKAKEGSDKVEVAIVLVEPEVPRISKLIELTRAYYELHEEMLSLSEETTEGEVEGYLRKLENHLEIMNQKRDRARELKQALGMEAEV